MRRLAALVLLLAAALAPARTASAQPPAGRILVMPFENAARDSRLVWLGEAAAVLLADDLNALGTPAITRTGRENRWSSSESCASKKGFQPMSVSLM